MKLLGQQAEVRRRRPAPCTLHPAARVCLPACLPALHLPLSPEPLLQAQPPHLEKQDAWGNQLDTLFTADAWKQLKAVSGGCCSKPARAAEGAWGLRLLNVWQTPLTMPHQWCS